VDPIVELLLRVLQTVECRPHRVQLGLTGQLFHVDAAHGVVAANASRRRLDVVQRVAVHHVGAIETGERIGMLSCDTSCSTHAFRILEQFTDAPL